MLYFVTQEHGRAAIDRLKVRLRPEAAARTTGLSYRDLFRKSSLPQGTYIFTALAVISEPERELACQIWDQLEGADGYQLMNHPSRVRLRYDLLREAHRRGINSFRPYRLSEFEKEDPRYPVFIRHEHQHSGSLSDLIYDRRQYEEQLIAVEGRGFRREGLIVIEFCDSRVDDGSFVRYATLKIGDHFIPRYLDLSLDWQVKRVPLGSQGVASDTLVQMEVAFQEKNPHKTWVAEIFQIANIDYGRIDYGVENGRLVVFEINTAPDYGWVGRWRGVEEKHLAWRSITGAWFHSQFSHAIETVDTRASGSPVPVILDSRKIRIAYRYQRKLRTRNRMKRLFKLVGQMGKIVGRVPRLRPILHQIRLMGIRILNRRR